MMKTKTVIVILSVLGLVLGACSELLTPPQSPSGTVTVRFGDFNRALTPNISMDDFTSYSLRFEDAADLQDDVTVINVNPLGQTVTLAPGTWKVTGEAYVYISGVSASMQGPAAKSTGDDEVVVRDNGKADTILLTLDLAAYKDPGQNGYFTWTWDMLQGLGLDTAGFTITSLSSPTSWTVDLLAEYGGQGSSNSRNTGYLALVPGQYTVSVSYTLDTKTGGFIEMFEIYSNVATQYYFDATDVLDTKPLTGTLKFSTTGASTIPALNTVSRATLTPIRIDSDAPLGDPVVITVPNNTATPWKLRVPLDTETIRIEVKLQNESGTVYTDKHLVTGISAKGKTDEEIVYGNTVQNVYFWNTGNQITGTNNTAVSYRDASGNTVTLEGLPTPNTPNKAIAGQTVKLTIARTNDILENRREPTALTALAVVDSYGQGGTQFNSDLLIQKTYETSQTISDGTRLTYYFTMPEITVNSQKYGVIIRPAFSTPPQTAAKPHIMFYGDSVTYGIGEGNWGREQENWTYPYYLGENFLLGYKSGTTPTGSFTQVSYVNAGVEGNMLAAAVYGGNNFGDGQYHDVYVDVMSATPSPDIVIVNLGLNDFVTGYQNKEAVYTVPYIYSYYSDVLKAICNGKRKVYVARFYTPDIMREFLDKWKYPEEQREDIVFKFDQLYKSLRDKYNVELIDDIWKGVWGIYTNGVHPNNQGYYLMAKNIYDAIKDNSLLSEAKNQNPKSFEELNPPATAP
jgi:lysophospholipase L1-like esterase